MEIILWTVTSAKVIRNYSQDFQAWRHLQLLLFISILHKIKTVGGHSFFNQNPYHFQNNAQFCIFIHIMNSSFRNKCGFSNIPEFGSNQQFKPNTRSLLSNITIFLWMIKLVFWNVFNICMSVWYIRNTFKNIFIY